MRRRCRKRLPELYAEHSSSLATSPVGSGRRKRRSLILLLGLQRRV
ncbi:unnamed protein product [Symbiodinium pilosum]|uniref:Uncharacterized protein n=1 Tax=Symbiodinium pilosum TaxID=2952 RepID=A0A812NEN0_SYMPI|nr:unnamed protein product [Symbiodinium pilosum]